MFDYICTYHYGRCVKGNDWYLKSTGVNRVYYIHSGNVTVLLDNTPYYLKPGMIYLFPQNLKFELLLSEQTRVDHTFLDFFSLPAITMDGPIAVDPANAPVIAKAAQILFALTEQHQTYPSMERNGYSDLVESYLVNLLTLMDKQYGIHTITDPRINRALDYIHHSYSSEITLDQLSEITNLEKNYFVRLFKQNMNATPYQYIKKYRFNMALSLIKRGKTLSETALLVGYSDVASFSHAFKKIYGIAPSDVLRPRETEERAEKSL